MKNNYLAEIRESYSNLLRTNQHRVKIPDVKHTLLTVGCDSNPLEAIKGILESVLDGQ